MLSTLLHTFDKSVAGLRRSWRLPLLLRGNAHATRNFFKRQSIDASVCPQAPKANVTGVFETSLVAHASLWPLYWASITMGIVVLGWYLQLSLLPWAALSGALAATLVMAVSLRRQKRLLHDIAICCGAVLLTISASLALGSASHDFSVDGQSYQQQGILAMMNGWNPVQERHYAGPESIWLSHYAKGPWILSASLAVLFGIESGKAVFWLFAFSLAGLSYALFSIQFRMSHRVALPCAVLFACNPIFCNQIQTYYVDGLVGSLLALAAVTTCMLVLNPTTFLAGAVSSCLIVAINLKFTAGPFVIVVLASVWLWCWLARRRAAVWTLFCAGVVGAVIGAAIGINPYLTNTLDHHHPLYPLSGPGKVDILSYNGGEAFLAHNRLYKAVVSLFSEANNAPPKNEADAGAAVPKIPGLIRSSELRAFYGATDLRMGGFGPWASLAFIIGLTYLALAAKTLRIDMRSEQALPFVAAVAMLASALIMPELWWARYAPHFWSALVFAVMYALSRHQPPNIRFIGSVALVIMAVNSMLVLGLAASNRVMQEADFRAQIASLRKISAHAPVLMHVSADSVRHRLTAEGVAFREGATTRCRIADDLRGSNATLCVPDAFADNYRGGAEWMAKLLHREISTAHARAQ